MIFFGVFVFCFGFLFSLQKREKKKKDTIIHRGPRAPFKSVFSPAVDRETRFPAEDSGAAVVLFCSYLLLFSVVSCWFFWFSFLVKFSGVVFNLGSFCCFLQSFSDVSSFGIVFCL